MEKRAYNETINHRAIEQDVATAIDESKAHDGEMSSLEWTAAAEKMLQQECERINGDEYSGIDDEGRPWTIRLAR